MTDPTLAPVDPRPVRPRSDRVAGWVVLLAAAGAAGALVTARRWTPEGVDHGPVSCPVMLLTGLPCPGCGLTRSWVYLAHGDLAAAVEYHLLGPLLAVLAVALVGWAVYAVVTRRPPESGLDGVSPWWGVGLLAVWLGYAVVRVVSLAAGQDTFARVLPG